MKNPPVPCRWCETPTKAYDTKPEFGHLTYAYECNGCGHLWTEDKDHLLPQLRLHAAIRRAAGRPRPKPWKAHKEDVIAAVRDVLPDEWLVLPTGGWTAEAIARRAAERYEAREQGMTAHPAGRRVRAIPSSAIPKRSPRTATTADDADKSEKEKCAEFLLDYLSRSESLDAKREDIFKAARGALYSEGTIKRAKTFAGIGHSRTNEPQPKTVWHHPDSATPKRSLHPATDAAYRAAVGDAR